MATVIVDRPPSPTSGLRVVDRPSPVVVRVALRRRRFVLLAVAITFVLLLNTAANLSISETLGSWSRTAHLLLTCSIGETWSSRNWEAYGFNALDTAVDICSQEDIVYSQRPCQSACRWDPMGGTGSSEYLTCDGSSSSNACDCPCKELVRLERPRFVVL